MSPSSTPASSAAPTADIAIWSVASRADQIADRASHAGQFGTLVAAAKTAKGKGPFTVFAPTDPSTGCGTRRPVRKLTEAHATSIPSDDEPPPSPSSQWPLSHPDRRTPLIAAGPCQLLHPIRPGRARRPDNGFTFDEVE
jgi:hypothetical protein